MKQSTIKVFDSLDEEFASILIELGMQPSIAKTITFLKNVDSADRRDVRFGTDLNIITVGSALRKLREDGVVTVTNEHPYAKNVCLRYTLAVPIDEIITGLEERVNAKAVVTMQNIETMKTIVEKGEKE